MANILKLKSIPDRAENIDKKIEPLANTALNETLRGFLLKAMGTNNEISSPEGYYYLTDLCDPVVAHLKRKYPKLQRFESEDEKFRVMGNKIHRMAEVWVQNMDKFISTESKLDGFCIGAKVVGKIDAKVGESIIEFKSKVNIPESVEDIIKYYPQDIEQLGFYSAIDPLTPKTNYLVFISQESVQRMKVYRVTIKSPEKILQVLKQRINLLDAVRENYVEELKLGKCRYCNLEKCVFKKTSLCPWNENKFGCGILDFIEIEEDVEYLKKLTEAKNKWDTQSEVLSVNEIIGSRKTLYNNSVEKMDSFWDEAIEKTLAKVYSSHISYLVGKNHGEDISEFPEPKIKDIRRHKKWIKLKTSKNPEGSILPYVSGACSTLSKYYLNHLPTYKILELGVICAQYGISRGYVIEYLPNLEMKFRVLEVNFNNPEILTKETNKILFALKQNKIKNFEGLLLCPEFWCRDCSIKSFCDNNIPSD